MTPMLAAIDWVNGLLVVVFILVSFAMVLAVLVQRPQGGGLAGAFGSAAGSGQTAFGARTGDALTIFTITIFVLFIVIAATLNHTIRPSKAVGGPAISAPAGGGTTSSAPAEAPATQQASGANPASPEPATNAEATTPAPARQTPAEQTTPPASTEGSQPAPGAAPANP